jgi:hypothetical protein
MKKHEEAKRGWMLVKPRKRVSLGLRLRFGRRLRARLRERVRNRRREVFDCNTSCCLFLVSSS